MKPPRSDLVRMLAASGAVACCGAVLTAAALSDRARVDVHLDGGQNRFDILVAGAIDPTRAWMPGAGEWRQGDPVHEIRAVTAADRLLMPGSAIHARVAVKNDSPRLPAMLTLTIGDSDPQGSATDPATGNFVELFDQLVFTVTEGEETLIGAVPAGQLDAHSWDEAFAPGEERILDVRIEMDAGADNRWQSAGTGIRFAFEAVAP
ncbi:hypothetical protein [Agromyces archimandritae]|uniref:Uncharacterized protein n=1 Tax=Agromyces archimandritae TaxID=2781962 RepID=A0A975IMC8_9MICO|nr:hypothetical protein [Agromyces archimandritae]QTX03320.1 hypothetical protein G127AT_07950 [Agromyces archimandritae]